jgi:hypothetical protein
MEAIQAIREALFLAVAARPRLVQTTCPGGGGKVLGFDRISPNFGEIRPFW